MIKNNTVIENAIFILAKQETTRFSFYENLINKNETYPYIINQLLYDLFINRFDPNTCPDNSYRAYSVIYDCVKDMKDFSNIKTES